MARRYKKVVAGHGHHGGAWKVAYADFVTAMMALFMVMWLLASTDAKTREEISNYFRSGILPEGDLSMNTAAQITPSVIEQSPVPPPPGQGTILDSEETAEEIQDKLKRMAAIDAEMENLIRNVKVKITPEGVLVETVDEGSGLMFSTASSELNEPLQRFLRAFSPMLVKLGHPVEINGHTDARPFAHGSKLNNWDLSYQRAAAAREILEGSGLPRTQVVGLFARGSSTLYVPEDPYASQNRRLSFLLRTRAVPAASIVPVITPIGPLTRATIDTVPALGGAAGAAAAVGGIRAAVPAVVTLPPVVAPLPVAIPAKAADTAPPVSPRARRN